MSKYDEVIIAMMRSGHNNVLCNVEAHDFDGNVIKRSKDIIHTYVYNGNKLYWHGYNGVWDIAIPFDRKTDRVISDYRKGQMYLEVLESKNESRID